MLHATYKPLYAVLNAVFIDMRTLGGVFMLLMNIHCLLQHYSAMILATSNTHFESQQRKTEDIFPLTSSSYNTTKYSNMWHLLSMESEDDMGTMICWWGLDVQSIWQLMASRYGDNWAATLNALGKYIHAAHWIY